MSNYILERNKNLYYRRRVPKEFSNFFPQNYEFRIPFRKISRFQAILKAKKINLLFEELLMTLQLDTFDKKESIVNEYMTMMKESLKEGYYSNNNSSRVSKTALQFEQLQCEQSLQSGFSHIASSQIEDVFNQADIDISEVDQSTYKQVEKLYLHKKIDMLQEFIHTIDPKKDFVNNPSLSSESVKDTGITFKRLYELFLKEKRIESPDMSQTSWRDYQSAYNDFIYVIGDVEDRDIASFTKDDFRAFVDALHNHIPASRTKKPEYRDLPYSKLKEIELTESEKMAVNTKKKKISTIKQMFDIAIDPRYEYLTVNHAQPFLIKESKGKKNKIDRKPLSNENLQKFFSSKFYTTKREYTLTHTPEKYWIPILAAFTGARQNELCQLHVADLKLETIDGHDIWYFDINDKDTKHLKNENAIRLIPLHPKLIELGFIDYYDSIKEKHERIWPNLRLHPEQERYNSDYNKTFMKFFRKYITTDESQVFHSFRHNVGDQLTKNAVKYRLPKDLMNRLMGHEPDKDMTSAVYSQGYGIKELYEGIKTLEFKLQGYSKASS